MLKIKLFLFFSFQLLIIASGYGQTEVTKDGFEKAINFANYKYVAYSLTNTEEKQKFIEDCNCNENTTKLAILNAISKRKTKTIAFSKEFDKLKEINIDLHQKNIASFLTDSIFNKSLSSKYIRIFNYGKSRKENQKFIAYKNDLYNSLIKILSNNTIEVPIIIEEGIATSKNNALSINETNKITENKQEKINWFDSFISQISTISIIISVLLSFLLMSYLHYRYLRNFVSNGVKNYIAKKTNRLGFDERFNRNQDEINRLKSEIIELKVLIHKLKYPERMYEDNELNNPNKP